MSEKTKKPRAKKQQMAQEIMAHIQPQQLATKVELFNLLRQSIADDRKALENQLDLVKEIK